MRMPFIARWPGKIPAGAACSELVTLMDLLPTFAGAAGCDVPGDRVIDGHDIRPLMFGEAGATSPYEAFYYYYTNQLQAVRSGKWKLYLPLDKQKANFTGTKSARAAAELYDLKEDPREEHNLAETAPEVVQRLLGLAQTAREDLGDEDQPGSGVRPVGWVDEARAPLLEPVCPDVAAPKP